MKRLFTLLFVLFLCLSSKAVDVTFTLSNLGISPATNRSVLVQAQNLPGVNGGSVIVNNNATYTTDVNGQFTLTSPVTNILYNITVQAPPARTAFMALMPYGYTNTNGTAYLVAASTATYPAGSVAWAIGTSDQRYAQIGTTGQTTSAGTNVTIQTNGTTVTINSTGVTNAVTNAGDPAQIIVFSANSNGVAKTMSGDATINTNGVVTLATVATAGVGLPSFNVKGLVTGTNTILPQNFGDGGTAATQSANVVLTPTNLATGSYTNYSGVGQKLLTGIQIGGVYSWVGNDDNSSLLFVGTNVDDANAEFSVSPTNIVATQNTFTFVNGDATSGPVLDKLYADYNTNYGTFSGQFNGLVNGSVSTNALPTNVFLVDVVPGEIGTRDYTGGHLGGQYLGVMAINLNNYPGGVSNIGDNDVVIRNWSTNVGDSGPGLAISVMGVNNGTGKAIIIADNAFELKHVPTNRVAGIIPGWGMFVMNTNSSMLGFAFASPTIGLDNGNYSLAMFDLMNRKFRVPFWVSGKYQPAQAGWKDAFTVDPLNDVVVVGNSTASLSTNFGTMHGNAETLNWLDVTNSITNRVLTASKLVLSDANKGLVSSTFTDTDLAPKSSPTFTGTATIPTANIATLNVGTETVTNNLNGSSAASFITNWGAVNGTTGYFTNLTVIAGIAPTTMTTNTTGGVFIEFNPAGDFCGPANVAMAASNTVYVRRFMLGRQTLISNLVWSLGTGVALGQVGMGIYTGDGNTKVVDTGAMSSGTGDTGTRSVNFTAVSLPPGFYITAWTANSTTIQILASGAGATGAETVYNAGANVYNGSAANASSGGVLPATLGVITGSTTTRIPLAAWKY